MFEVHGGGPRVQRPLELGRSHWLAPAHRAEREPLAGRVPAGPADAAPPDDRPDADADPSGIRGVATMAGPFDFLPLDTAATIATFGDVADLTTTQPINFVRSDSPPFLLLTGASDTTVYPKNSRAWHSA